MMLVASYYDFGARVVERARATLLEGGGILDAVEEGIKVIEADRSNRSVGIGGLPNFEGEVELDAAIMEGRLLRCGSVAAVKNVEHPISLARKVMELTPHVMIVGEGAVKLARLLGFREVRLPIEEARAEYLRRLREIEERLGRGEELPLYRRVYELLRGRGHDTTGVVVFKDGDFAAGVSTSGLALKFPGRVGDSPIIGAGLYADNRVGAAICTGLGEIAIRLVAAKSALDLVDRGCSAQEAAEAIVSRVNEISAKEGVLYRLGVLVVDKRLEIGAAANYKFSYAYWTEELGEEIALREAALLKAEL